MSTLTETFKKDGFVTLQKVFSTSEVEDIRTAYRECIKRSPDEIEIIYEKDGTTVRSTMGYHECHRILDQYTRDARVINVVHELVGAPVYVSQSKINPKAPSVLVQGRRSTDTGMALATKGKKWNYHRGFAFWHLLDGMPQSSMVSVFIFLTEQSEDNGAVFALKGSHAGIGVKEINDEISKESNDNVDDTAEYLSLQIRDQKLSEYKERFERVSFVGSPGDVVVLDSRLLHASEDNRTTSSRDLMVTVYNPIDNLATTPRKQRYLCEPCNGPLEPYYKP